MAVAKALGLALAVSCGPRIWAEAQRHGAAPNEPRNDASAAESEPASPATIVVTAQRRAQNIHDVALAVSAFDGGALRDIGVLDASHLQTVVPSLTYTATGNVAQPYLRGVGTRQAQLGMEPPVATYVDDRYVARPYAAMFDMLDVERVEVLKGPLGSLYGRNAAGGAIRALTKDPGNVPAVEIAGKLGSYDHAMLRLLAGGPILRGLRGQIAASLERRDGFATNVVPSGRGESDDLDRHALRAKLLWELNDAAAAKLSLSWWRQFDWMGRDLTVVGAPEANRGVALYGGTTSRERNHFASAIEDDNDMSEAAMDLRFDVDLGNLDFVSTTTYADSDFVQVFDIDASSTVLVDLHATERSSAWTQEVQLLSAGNAAFDWLIGAFYYREDGSNVFAFPATVSAQPAYPVGTDVTNGLQHVESEAYALYAEGVFELAEKWSFTLGGRWNRESKSATLEAIPGTFTNAPTPYSSASDWEDFTPRAALEYRGKLGLAYLSYARGFKSGGFSYPASLNAVLDPDVIRSYELGLKLTLLDARLSLDAAVFASEMEDLQVTRGGADALIATENAADGEARGVELDFDLTVANGFGVYGGIAVTDSAYANYTAGVLVPLYAPPYGSGPLAGGLDVSGRSLLRTPDQAWYVGARAEWRLRSGARVPFRANYAYKGSYYFDFAAVPEMEWLRQAPYGVLSARVGFAPAAGDWEVGLWGTNLTDEVYLDDAVVTFAASRVSYADPRMLGIDFRIELR